MSERTHTGAHAHTRTHTSRCTPTRSPTQMTACHGLHVTSQLRPPPSQPLTPLGASVSPCRDTEERRGMLLGERSGSGGGRGTAAAWEASTSQTGGNWRWGQLIGVQPSTSTLNSKVVNGLGQVSEPPRPRFCNPQNGARAPPPGSPYRKPLVQRTSRSAFPSCCTSCHPLFS